MHVLGWLSGVSILYELEGRVKDADKVQKIIKEMEGRFNLSWGQLRLRYNEGGRQDAED